MTGKNKTCCFCEKSSAAVATLFEGGPTNSRICSECVSDCVLAMADASKKTDAERRRYAAEAHRLANRVMALEERLMQVADACAGSTDGTMNALAERLRREQEQA